MSVGDPIDMSPHPSAFLSGNASRVLHARYLKRDEEGRTVETPEEMFERVAQVVSGAERQYGASNGDLETLRAQYYTMMASCTFMPNSPTLMNAGRGNGMLSACFVIPVEDSIESIFSAVKQTALVQKAGGGTGFSFSRLRPKGDRVTSSGGTTSGPLSFMRVFAEATNAVQQGAFRRGANMGILRVDHPDIIDFINAKQDLCDFTNFNLSIAVTEDFMAAATADPAATHMVTNPRTDESCTLAKEGGCWSVGEILDLIALRAWQTGEPGLIFIDRMNEANPTPNIGAFESTNACGEQPLLPRESCNLGSINLIKFVRTETGRRFLDFDRLSETARNATRFLDDVIDATTFPLPEFEAAAKGNRKIGLGVMGFADSLFSLGISYDSEEALDLGAKIMQVINQASHETSVELAEQRGVFPNWEGSTWADRGIEIRNACTTCVAPTGSISVIAGCSGGIEPAFALAFSRNVLDGSTLPEVNAVFEKTAREEGFYTEALMREVAEVGSVQGMKQVPEHWRRVFVTAHDIAPEWHVRMQAAFQEHCDASISKTINLKNSATQQDVRNALILAHKLGCKGVTVYRDGCRANQPMSLQQGQDTPLATAKPIDLPEIMPAVRIKQLTPFGNMHVKVVIDPRDRAEREVFAQLGKGGDLANSDLEAICRLISLYLRLGGHLEDVLGQLEGIGSSLTLPTKDGTITSLSDGLAKAIAKYTQARKNHGIEGIFKGKKASKTLSRGSTHAGNEAQKYRIRCPMPECSGVLSFQEGCALCHACGFSLC